MRDKIEKDICELYSYIDEVDLALNDESRTINDSEFVKKMIKSASLGMGTGSIVATAGLIGVAIPNSPALTGFYVGWLFQYLKNRKEEKAYYLALKKAIEKQTALIKEIKKQWNKDRKRLEYLLLLNQQLQEKIIELQEELKKYQNKQR